MRYDAVLSQNVVEIVAPARIISVLYPSRKRIIFAFGKVRKAFEDVSKPEILSEKQDD
jgi:hypothetical protein